jgi:hypothetical protein
MGHILQERSQRFEAGSGSKEKVSSQKSGVSNKSKKKHLSFKEDDMRDP